MSGGMHCAYITQGIDEGSGRSSAQEGDRSVGLYAGVAVSSVGGWWVSASFWPLEMEEGE